MEINFKSKRFGGYDKTEVLSYISNLITEYNEKLTRYVDTIKVLKAKNLELTAQLSSKQANEKIAQLEAERRQLTERECELNQQLEETRMKLEILADRIVELESEKTDGQVETEEKAEEKKVQAQSAPVVEVKVEEKSEIETKTEKTVAPQTPVALKPVKTKTVPPVRLPELPRNTVQTKKDILSALESVTL